MGIQVKSSGGSPTLQSRSVTPSASTQYITPQSGYDGLSQVTVNGDSDLVSSNIKSGVNIFGVTGNYSGNLVVANPTDLTYSGNQIKINFSSTLGTAKAITFKIFVYYTDNTYSIAFPFYENNWSITHVYFSSSSDTAPSNIQHGGTFVTSGYTYALFWGYNNKSVSKVFSSTVDMTGIKFVYQS